MKTKNKYYSYFIIVSILNYSIDVTLGKDGNSNSDEEEYLIDRLKIYCFLFASSSSRLCSKFQYNKHIHIYFLILLTIKSNLNPGHNPTTQATLSFSSHPRILCHSIILLSEILIQKDPASLFFKSIIAFHRSGLNSRPLCNLK